LFKHSAAVIHHGGAGTTGKALRAGIPSIILPFTSDQPFWGRQVYKLGAGPKPLYPKRLTSRDVADAIHLIKNDQVIKSRAEDIGQRLKTEDGVTQAVNLIQRYGRMKRA
jgi:sterol 3beta-glucosyltransferase